jgi:hypothetical protein
MNIKSTNENNTENFNNNGADGSGDVPSGVSHRTFCKAKWPSAAIIVVEIFLKNLFCCEFVVRFVKLNYICAFPSMNTAISM